MPRRGTGAPPSSWADGALVGRDELIAELATAAEEAGRGSGSIFVLAGEAGIGKSSVARVVGRSAREQLTVTWARCSADGTAPPFWPWRALVGTPVAAEVGHAERAPGAERFEVLNDLRDQLVTLARGGPRLHVIEDVQWADVASVLLLVHLGAEVQAAPLMVVCALRTGETLDPQLEDAIEELRREARVRQLLPLADRDIAVLVREAGITADAELVALVRARTGGNPLFVAELLRAVHGSDPGQLRDAVAGRVPTRVSELVAHRLDRLPDAVADVVVTAAVVGTEGDARTLARTAGADVAEILDLLEQARAARLFDAAPPGRWQFRHDLVRDAVYEHVPAAAAARRHAAVLEALAAEQSTPAAVLAHHALAALPLFDGERAVALAARAGEEAFAQHAYEEAIRWFGRALTADSSDTSPRWRAELLVHRGEALRHIGNVEEARQAFLAAGALTDDPALLARAALGYASPGADLGIAYRTYDAQTGELLERAIAAQPPGDSVTTVLLEARLAAETYFSDTPGRSRELATSALARARRSGDDHALAAAIAIHHDAFVVGQADLADQLRESEQLLELARAAGSSAGLLIAHRARVFDLLAAGDVAGVDAEVLAFSRLAEPLRAPAYLWWPALWSAMRALLDGRHDTAEARAVEAYGIGEHVFAALAMTNLSFLLFFLRREQGRLAELEQLTRDYVAGHPDVPAIRVGLTFLLAELGRTDEVRAMLGGLDEAALERLHDRNWPASWFQLARAAHLTGDRSMAATLLQDRHRPGETCVMVSLATACLGATDLALAWLRHTVGDLDGASDRYAAAATTNARIGARSWLAQARVDHARCLLDRGRTGDAEEAARLLGLATEAVDDIGLPVLARTIETLRAAPSGEPRLGDRAVFRRTGEVWEVEFRGRTARLPHAAGLRDLTYLLARPSEAVSVLELIDEPGHPAPRDRGADAFDEPARRQIRARLHELDAEEADAEAHGDGERAALVREERQQLAETVARDLGLGGRSRRVGDPVERARKTVSTRIRRAIVAVGRAHPELGRHLERSVDTGAWCAYRPAEPVTWTT